MMWFIRDADNGEIQVTLLEVLDQVDLVWSVTVLVWYAVADPEGGGGRGFKYPPSEVFFFFRLSVYENSHGPGP